MTAATHGSAPVVSAARDEMGWRTRVTKNSTRRFLRCASSEWPGLTGRALAPGRDDDHVLVHVELAPEKLRHGLRARLAEPLVVRIVSHLVGVPFD